MSAPDQPAPLRRIRPGGGEWPTQLGDLGETSPEQLWLAGAADLRLLALRSVAIVGARAATPYGMQVASAWAEHLAAAGWVVVSGAAYGIDSAAHRGALLSGGCTIAVLAGGMAAATGRSVQPLVERVLAQGVVVCEQAPDVMPRRHSFLERNRLIAALARGVIVVEAGRRSGALNTARHAEAINRCVMAVPGPVTSAVSAGTHALISDGRANLVSRPEDVIELLEPVGVPVESPGAPDGPAREVLAALADLPQSLAHLTVALGGRYGDQDLVALLLALRDRGLARQSAAGWSRARTRR